MAKKKKKSSAPSGFTWSRNRGNVTVGWKNHGYNDQKFRTKTATSKKTDWSPKKGGSISKSASSYTFKLAASAYYPETNVYLKWVDIDVCGTTKDTSKINYTQSPWASPGVFKFEPPRKPTSVGHSQISSKYTAFVVEIGEHVNNKTYWGTKVQYQTCLVLNSDYATYDKIPQSAKKNTAGENSNAYWTIYNSIIDRDETSFTYYANDTEHVGDAEKAVRWFRARVVGPAGASGWVEDHIAYSEPKAVSEIKASATKNDSGTYNCKVTWTSLNSLNNPIDTIQIQYSISTPSYNPITDKITPASTNWQVAEIGGDNTLTPSLVKKTTDTKTYKLTEYFVIPELMPKDQMIFVRVNTTNNGKSTYGDITYVTDENGDILDKNTVLSAPENLYVEPLQDNLVRVIFDNQCEVSGAFVAVGFLTEEASRVYKSLFSDVSDDRFGRINPGRRGYWYDVTETKYNAIAIIPLTATGEITSVIDIPASLINSDYSLVLQTFVGPTPEKTGEFDGADIYTVTYKLSSDAIQFGDIPQPPTILNLENLLDGNVRISFDWAWDGAKSAEIAWSNYALAMESTDEPSSYIMTDTKRNSVIIKDLEVGVTWYFWVRYLSDTRVTPWSNPRLIALTSAPNIPSLSATKYYILLNGEDTTTLSWSYVSTDNTEQAAATIAQIIGVGDDISFKAKGDGETTTFDVGGLIDEVKSATVNGEDAQVTSDDSSVIFGTAPDEGTEIEVIFTSTDAYYKPIIKIPNEEQDNPTVQNTLLDASDIDGWEVGGEYSLAVKVASESMLESEWSDPITIAVPEPLTCSITTNLYDGDISDEDPYPKLQTLATPLIVTVSGFKESTDSVSVYIERAENYFIDRPDGGIYGGYTGETVFAETQYGIGEFSIEQTEIRGYLDDTAPYRIVAIIQDKYGQVATAEQEFVVAWAHQALMPNAQISVDRSNLLVFIKILKPEEGEVAEGDVCDIYRASVDGWELVYDGATFDTTYVDPYPTLGEHGGHRIVYRTFNGDYIDANNQFAWVDFDPEDGDLIESYSNIIDFGSDRCELWFNTDLSNKWAKDFQKTKYLGGSIQGDWNEGVEKSGSISTYEITSEISNIEAFHRLGEYSGECRVRTTDGSNYVANVNINESISHDHYYDPQGAYTNLASYSLDIERVDSPTRTLIALRDGDIEGFNIGEWFGASPLIIDEEHSGGLVLPNDKILTLVQPEGD